MYQTAIIPFPDTIGFISFLNKKNKEIFASPKSICEIFDISWQSQHTKLSENESRWKYKTIMLKLPGDSQKRKIGLISNKKIRSWVCSINPEKIKLKMRQQLIDFQDECDQVLLDYWTKGIAVNPRSNYSLDQSFITESISASMKETMQELALTLKETFVTNSFFLKSMDQYEKRLTELEQEKKYSDLNKLTIMKISFEQAKILRTLVKEKSSDRIKICSIWKQFRQKFQIKSYHNLPNSKFQNALRWINQL